MSDSIKKYIKKPVVISAIQLAEGSPNIDDVIDFISSNGGEVLYRPKEGFLVEGDQYSIVTLEGDM